MKDKTFYGELVAKKEGTYTLYVFQDDTQYIMCTKLPNWNINVNIGDKGYVTTEEVCAGEKYYEPNTQQEKTYQYSNIYIKNFIKDNNNKSDIIV